MGKNDAGRRGCRCAVLNRRRVKGVNYYSIHSLTLKCAMYTFFMAPDELRWVYDPFCGVLSAVRSSPPKTLPTVHNI